MLSERMSIVNPIISELNDVLLDWKKENDHFNAITAQFAESGGFICLSGVPLYPTDSSLTLQAVLSDAETIAFFLSGGRSIEIAFAWPEDKPPVLSQVLTLTVHHFDDESQ